MGTVKPNVKEWLQLNRERFITFSIEEIADTALVAGFSKEEVDRWILETQWGRKVA